MSIFTTIAVSLAAAAFGTGFGFWLARFRLERRFEAVSEAEREYRRKRIEWHRERYQDSTTRIHRSPEGDAIADPDVKEELEQARLDLVISEEDRRLERSLMQEEIEELRAELDRMNADSVVFVDVDVDSEVDSAHTGLTDLGDSEKVPSAQEQPPDADDIDADDIVGAGWVEEPIDDTTDAMVSDESESKKAVEPDSPPTIPTPVSLPIEQGLKPAPPSAPRQKGAVPEDIERLFAARSTDIVAKNVSFVEKEANVDPAPETEVKATSDQEFEAEPEPAVLELEPEPAVVELEAEPAIEEPEAEPAVLEPEAESAVVEPEAEPAVVEPEAESAAVEPEAEPAIEESDHDPVPEEVESEPEPAARDSSDFAFHWEPPVRKLSRIQLQRRGNRDSDRSGLDRASTLRKVIQTPTPPAFQSLSKVMEEWTTKTLLEERADADLDETRLVQSIVQLPEDGFDLLNELGYARLEKLSDLSNNEIRRLAAVFRINEIDIEQGWIPSARAHLNIRTS